MSEPYVQLSTGIPALDKVLHNLIPGDNIVWQVDSIDEYRPFVHYFAEDVIRKKGTVIYFRFADHEELLTDSAGIETYIINLENGFETATAEIHRIIENAGRGASFVFDCLSDLTVHWYSDLMLGNFFMLTCPFIYYMNSIAFFALIRHKHSLPVVASIRDTTQLILDVSRYQGNLYVHPLKVWQRYSPTMYLPHLWEDEKFIPVTDSATVSEVVSAMSGSGMHSAKRVLDVWYRTFIQAQELLEEIESGLRPSTDKEIVYQKLFRMMISRDDRIISLASKYITLEDLIRIKERLLGTGLIGGKSVGMLLARSILIKNDPSWSKNLEVHDSFYIGSDVFYTYIVTNGCWWIRKKQRDPNTFLDDVYMAKQIMLNGIFPEFIRDQFVEMLDYFGQSPIIVRSSSLLEDNFGNAFSGKYESVFCPNQGTRSERLDAFIDAVRTVYSSAMSRDALLYRADRKLLERDEQMAILVQRVSGSVYGNLFFPQIAGVAYSFNPYSWSEKIDPAAGVVRLVCGLGTRAVDKHDDDYTRIVALNDPSLRPESNFNEMKEYSQKRVDVLDLDKNNVSSRDFNDICRIIKDFPAEIVASKEKIPYGKNDKYYWTLTFEKLLTQTDFVNKMSDLLKCLHQAYGNPVDIEFTVNFRNKDIYQINLLQCRTLQMADSRKAVEPPSKIDKEDMIIEAHGAIIGQSMSSLIERIIYVVPEIYGAMNEQDRYSVAKLIGRITHAEKETEKIIMLIGPGRWGTSMPFLGIPVNFSEINTVSVIGELVEMNENLVPDVSLGTHFFNDIVESKILYIVIYSLMDKNTINKKFFTDSPNRLPDILPTETKYLDAVKVIDTSFLNGYDIILNANIFKQQAILYKVKSE